MTGPVLDHPAGYRWLWWQQTRQSIRNTTGLAVLAVPGLVGGVLLTRAWTSEWLAGWAVGIAGAVSLVAGIATVRASRWLVRRAGQPRPPQSEPPQLVRAIVRGEVAVVAHPRYPPVRPAAALLTGVLCLVLASGLLPDPWRDALGPGVVAVAGLVGATAGGLLGQLWTDLVAPRVALFRDRLETTRLVGRRSVPWSEVSLAIDDERAGTVTVHLARGHRFPIPVGTGAREVADAINRYRSDPDARAGIAQHILPRVVDAGPDTHG